MKMENPFPQTGVASLDHPLTSVWIGDQTVPNRFLDWMDEIQRLDLRAPTSPGVYLVLGGVGTGKSHLMHYFLKEHSMRYNRVLPLFIPTGIAGKSIPQLLFNIYQDICDYLLLREQIPFRRGLPVEKRIGAKKEEVSKLVNGLSKRYGWRKEKIMQELSTKTSLSKDLIGNILDLIISIMQEGERHPENISKRIIEEFKPQTIFSEDDMKTILSYLALLQRQELPINDFRRFVVHLYKGFKGLNGLEKIFPKTKLVVIWEDVDMCIDLKEPERTLELGELLVSWITNFGEDFPAILIMVWERDTWNTVASEFGTYKRLARAEQRIRGLPWITTGVMTEKDLASLVNTAFDLSKENIRDSPFIDEDVINMVFNCNRGEPRQTIQNFHLIQNLYLQSEYLEEKLDPKGFKYNIRSKIDVTNQVFPVMNYPYEKLTLPDVLFCRAISGGKTLTRNDLERVLQQLRRECMYGIDEQKLVPLLYAKAITGIDEAYIAREASKYIDKYTVRIWMDLRGRPNIVLLEDAKYKLHPKFQAKIGIVTPVPMKISDEVKDVLSNVQFDSNKIRRSFEEISKRWASDWTKIEENIFEIPYGINPNIKLKLWEHDLLRSEAIVKELDRDVDLVFFFGRGISKPLDLKGKYPNSKRDVRGKLNLSNSIVVTDLNRLIDCQEFGDLEIWKILSSFPIQIRGISESERQNLRKTEETLLGRIREQIIHQNIKRLEEEIQSATEILPVLLHRGARRPPYVARYMEVLTGETLPNVLRGGAGESILKRTGLIEVSSVGYGRKEISLKESDAEKELRNYIEKYFSTGSFLAQELSKKLYGTPADEQVKNVQTWLQIMVARGRWLLGDKSPQDSTEFCFRRITTTDAKKAIEQVGNRDLEKYLTILGKTHLETIRRMRSEADQLISKIQSSREARLKALELKKDFDKEINALDLLIKELADTLGKTRKSIFGLLKGENAISKQIDEIKVGRNKTLNEIKSFFSDEKNIVLFNKFKEKLIAEVSKEYKIKELEDELLQAEEKFNNVSDLEMSSQIKETLDEIEEDLLRLNSRAQTLLLSPPDFRPDNWETIATFFLTSHDIQQIKGSDSLINIIGTVSEIKRSRDKKKGNWFLTLMKFVYKEIKPRIESLETLKINFGKSEKYASELQKLVVKLELYEKSMTKYGYVKHNILKKTKSFSSEISDIAQSFQNFVRTVNQTSVSDNLPPVLSKYEDLEAKLMKKNFVIRWNQELKPKIEDLLKHSKIGKKENAVGEIIDTLMHTRAPGKTVDIDAIYSECKMKGITDEFPEFIDILLTLYEIRFIQFKILKG